MPTSLILDTDIGTGAISFATGWILVEDDGLTRFTADPEGPHRIVTELAPDRVARGIVDRMLAAIA